MRTDQELAAALRARPRHGRGRWAGVLVAAATTGAHLCHSASARADESAPVECSSIQDCVKTLESRAAPRPAVDTAQNPAATSPSAKASKQPAKRPMVRPLPPAAFGQLRKLYARQAAECAKAQRDGPECKRSGASDASSGMPACAPCTQLDESRKWLVKGTLAYLKILQAHGADKPENIKAAYDAINAAYVFDPSDGGEMARVVDEFANECRARGVAPSELIAALGVVTDPNVRALLRERINQSAAVPEGLKQAVKADTIDGREFVTAFLGLDREWQTRVSRWLDEAKPNYRGKLYEYLSSSTKLQIVVQAPPNQDPQATVALRELVNSLVMLLSARTAEGPYLPKEYARQEWPTGETNTVATCRNGERAGCDVVLALCTDVAGGPNDSKNSCGLEEPQREANGPELRVRGKIHFVQQEARESESKRRQDVARRGKPLEIAVPLTQPRADPTMQLAMMASDARRAATELVERITSQLEIVGDAAARSRPAQIRILPIRVPGVSVHRIPACLQTDAQRALRNAGLRLEGQCDPDFDKAFRSELETLDVLTAHVDRPGSEMASLTLSRDGSADGACRGKARLSPGNERSLFDFRAMSDANPEKRRAAGVAAAEYVAELYAGGACSAGDGQSPQAEPTVGGGHRFQALALTGLPWLTDGKSTTGDGAALVASILDGALLAAGVGSLGYSTALRDDYAGGNADSLDTASTLRAVGFGLLGTVLAARIVAVGLYGSGDGGLAPARGSTGRRQAAEPRFSVLPTGLAITY